MERVLAHPCLAQNQLAVVLLDRGANPYARDWVTGPITEYLYNKVDASRLLENEPGVDYHKHPLLHCLVATEWQRAHHEPMRGLSGFRPTFVDDADAGPDVDAIGRIDSWLEGALVMYGAQQMKRHLATEVEQDLDKPLTVRHRKM